MNRLMANFFWHNSDGNINFHWLHFSQMCKPCSDGGLGLQKFSDIQRLLQRDYGVVSEKIIHYELNICMQDIGKLNILLKCLFHHRLHSSKE